MENLSDLENKAKGLLESLKGIQELKPMLENAKPLIDKMGKDMQPKQVKEGILFGKKVKATLLQNGYVMIGWVDTSGAEAFLKMIK